MNGPYVFDHIYEILKARTIEIPTRVQDNPIRSCNFTICAVKLLL